MPQLKKTEEKKKFYVLLENAVGRIPFSNIELIIGDFNAQTRREGKYTPIAGQYSLHQETKTIVRRQCGLL